MKVAARFPIKPYKPLFWGILMLYILTAVLAAFSLQSRLLLGFYPVLMVCAIFTIKHYRRLTSASDDLCWNGDSWLFQDANQQTIYLELQATSWLSRYFTLLHFKAQPALLSLEPNTPKTREFFWLFSLRYLGERSYRELCYLVKQNIRHQVSKS
ncbi:protein YgfX [Aliikangiella sp. IMCC44653]